MEQEDIDKNNLRMTRYGDIVREAKRMYRRYASGEMKAGELRTVINALHDLGDMVRQEHVDAQTEKVLMALLPVETQSRLIEHINDGG